MPALAALALAAAGRGNPYRDGVPFIWCSANLTVALATQCLLGVVYEHLIVPAVPQEE